MTPYCSGHSPFVCDCDAERLRREGAEAERRAIVAWLLGQLDEDHGYSAATCSFLRITAAHIQAGEHLRGEGGYPCNPTVGAPASGPGNQLEGGGSTPPAGAKRSAHCTCNGLDACTWCVVHRGGACVLCGESEGG